MTYDKAESERLLARERNTVKRQKLLRQLWRLSLNDETLDEPRKLVVGSLHRLADHQPVGVDHANQREN